MIHNITTARNSKPACSKLDLLEQRLAGIADAGPQAIDDRLAELDREWTAGRVTKATIGVLLVVGFALTALLNPWWLILPAIGGVSLLQYLFTQTLWLGKVVHEMGYRTGFEVDQEKIALKALRGDFRDLPTVHDIENHNDISRLEGEGGITVDEQDAKVDPKEAAKEVLETS